MVRWLPITIVLSLAFAGCAIFSGNRGTASLPRDPLPNAPLALSPQASHSCKIWRYSLHSHISHISVSRDGAYVLASTSSEPSHRRSKGKKRAAQDAHVRLFSSRGALLWTYGLAHPVKAQAIGGGIVAVSAYDNKLHVLNMQGKQLWEREHLGRPLILPKSKRIVILNDDDSEPETAFVSYDYEGRRKAFVQTPRGNNDKSEPLDMFASTDESQIVVTTMNNDLYGYSPDGKLLWQGTSARDIVTVVVSGGTKPRVFVVSGQELTAYEVNLSTKKATKIWGEKIDRKYEAARLSESSEPVLFLYGNTQNGQSFAAYNPTDGSELWRRSYPSPSTYTSQVYLSMASQPYMTVAVDNGEKAGTLHVMGIGTQGMALFDTPVRSGDGIYSYGLADSAQALVVGAGDPGDGVLEYYRVKSGSCQ